MHARRIVPLLVCVTLVVLAGCQHVEQHAAAKNAMTRSSQTDFPYVVPFEQGAAKFESGDGITITEVRGTSPDMLGGIYRISGTYTLASHENATLAASVTAKKSEDGRGYWNKAQTTTITKGSGTFTLFLPMSIDGWPHISFYGKSSDFGGTYLGTGDSVLRKWWGS
jgi:hypothetical protein